MLKLLERYWPGVMLLETRVERAGVAVHAGQPDVEQRRGDFMAAVEDVRRGKR